MSEIPYKSIYIASKLKEIDDLRTALANAEKALIPLAELNLVGVTGDIVYQRDKSYIKVSDISRAKESLAELRRVSGKI